jgi:hypothetical protein
MILMINLILLFHHNLKNQINPINQGSDNLIDNDIYHVGASFKDLGKKLFAFNKMEMKSSELLKNIV